MFGGRRLSNCSDIGVQQTEWVGTNPHHWSTSNASTAAKTIAVESDADVKVVEVRRCGINMVLKALTDPLEISLKLPKMSLAAPSGYKNVPHCVLFDPTTGIWSADGISVKADQTGLTHTKVAGDAISCLATRGGGSFTAVWKAMWIPTTTTTTTT